ncbi:tellurite resistance TerB family protein [Pusillimonas caeni]|uniref:tellurite resistance TerB family protein n=1 Tax=Pusillimonas caeni TaxID=1348472 RepID=UPI000E59FF11|nr:tellurite resistance TerB family protein [Pusillimonas caeni]TFL15018.1 tellurite resistance TerB family protein [Pusillimonas caeni]
MSIQQLLQQVLQSGQGLVQDATSATNQNAGLASKLGGFGGGALAGGALGLLLGNKKFRKMGGKFAAYGGAAALGALALKTYQDWQQKSAAQAAAGAPAAAGPNVSAAAHTPSAAPALPAGQLEEHSRIILAAMITAAKADGHIGAEERQLLDQEVAKLTSHPEDLSWFDAQLANPVDPAGIAALATTPETAAEVYLASLLIVDEQSYMEKAYLDELARRLPLPEGLKIELESKVRSLA